MKLRYCLNISILFLSVILMFACQKECDHLPVSRAGLGFYTISNDQAVKKNVDSLLIHPVDLPDSIIYAWVKNINFVRLPLSPSVDQTSFVIRLNEFTDTLMVQYTRQLYYVSEECGFSVNYFIKSLSSTIHGFDSVTIVQPNVQSVNEEHIRIYF
jgi:hypothetical protein